MGLPEICMQHLESYGRDGNHESSLATSHERPHQALCAAPGLVTTSEIKIHHCLSLNGCLKTQPQRVVLLLKAVEPLRGGVWLVESLLFLYATTQTSTACCATTSCSTHTQKHHCHGAEPKPLRSHEPEQALPPLSCAQ